MQRAVNFSCQPGLGPGPHPDGRSSPEATIDAEAGPQDVFSAASAVGKCERDAQGRQPGIQVSEENGTPVSALALGMAVRPVIGW
jgi:hypothetical protein